MYFKNVIVGFECYVATNVSLISEQINCIVFPIPIPSFAYGVSYGLTALEK